MSEREEEKSRGFKVEDRRRFSSEGELKPEHQRPDEFASASSPEGAGTESPPPHPPEPGVARHRPQHGEETSSDMSFSAFVVSLSTQALMHLGEIPDPMTNQQQRDLRAAQHLIDILGILADKTRGNLDRDEESLLRSILFDLRMKYVETARQHSN